MEATILRFPHISRQIFEHLDVKSLTKSRIIARLWNESICAERFFWIEIILHMTLSEKVWRTILRKSNLDQLSKISRDICNYYKKASAGKTKRTPLHFVAQFGETEIVKKCFLEEEIKKNPSDLDGWTPLHLAAENGHAEICQIIVDSVEVNMYLINSRFLRERGMASTPKKECQVFLCIFQKSSAMATLGKFLWEG